MQKITLTPSQAVALDALIDFANGNTEFALTTLEGYAGTGKTTLIAHLMEALAGSGIGPSIAVMAPTNKAVGVIQQKIGQHIAAEYGSLHSFLGLRLTEKEDGSQTCLPDGDSSLHKYDLAIIDECSMVSESLFTAIMTSRRRCRVLFVGDPAQLPPVEDRNESPVFRLVSNRIRLSEVVRQARDNPIIAASIKVREAIEQMRRTGLAELAGAFPPPPSAAGIMQGGINAIVDTIIYEQQQGRVCRAVAWTNKTVEAINARVHAGLFPDCKSPFAVGEEVMAQSEFKTVEDKDFAPKPVRVFNSEELIVESVVLEKHPRFSSIPAWKMVLSRDDGSRVIAFYPVDYAAYKSEINRLWTEYRALKQKGEHKDAKKISDHAWDMARAFAPIRHNYAMTAHKSQGSTFDTALVHWDDLSCHRQDFDFNRLLYVAMTRASKHLAIVIQ